MINPIRKLNTEGIRRFTEFIRDGALVPAPIHLLSNPETSVPLPSQIVPSEMNFADRFEFGVYLNRLLEPLDSTLISNDRGFWTALALVWFDRKRKDKKKERRRKDKENRNKIS